MCFRFTSLLLLLFSCALIPSGCTRVSRCADQSLIIGLKEKARLYPEFVLRPAVEVPFGDDPDRHFALMVRAEQILAGNIAMNPEVEREILMMGLAAWDPFLRKDLLRGLPPPNEGELVAYYQDHLTRYSGDPVARFEYIFAPVLPGDDPESVHRQISALRDEYDQWGTLRVVAEGMALETSRLPLSRSPGTMNSNLEAFLFAGETAEISPVIATNGGFHILWRHFSRPARLPDLDRDREKVISDLNSERIEEARVLIEDSLRAALPVVRSSVTAGWMIGEYDIPLGDLNLALDAVQGDETLLANESTNQLRLLRHNYFGHRQNFHLKSDYRHLVEIGEANILARAYLRAVAEEASKNPVSEEEILARYLRSPERWSIPEQKEVRMFRLRHTEAEGEDPRLAVIVRRQAREQLSRLRDLLISGSDLMAIETESLLTGHSFEVVDMGTAPEGPRGRELDMAVRSLNAGQFSPLFRGASDFRFYQVVTTMDPILPPLEDVEDQIREAIRRETAAHWVENAIQGAWNQAIEEIDDCLYEESSD